jgi:peptidoglycan-associated lipoprotein
MNHHRFGLGWFALSAIVALGGCSRNRAVPAVEPVPVADDTDGEAARRDSLAAAEAARRDSLAREAALAEERDRRLREARAALDAVVYFDYDRADLTEDARRILDGKLRVLTSARDVTLRLTGHADDRGSDEYNLALGHRRAATARRYLVAYGMADDRFEIVSFGEERPTCTQSIESCWSRNRRVEFEITAGAELAWK